jgi:hypothetical protein
MTKQHTDEDGNVTAEPIEQEVVGDPKPVVVPCTVGVNASHTIPVGSYSNVKVGVHLSVTCEPHEVDNAFELVSEWVGEKLSSMVNDVVQEYGVS